MSIKLISKHRTCLMAIAMIWIGLYHIYFTPNNKLVDFIVYKQGYLGIDVFVFLSGFGIYQSLKKDKNFFSFILKRIKRIFPYCIPIYVISMFVNKSNIFLFATDCLGLSIFFRNNLINWFSSFIFIAYLLSPLYNKIFKVKPIIVTFISIVFVSVICFLTNDYQFTYIYFRFAIYILGFYFGYLFCSNIKINKSIYVLLIVFSILGVLSIYLLNHYYRNDITHVYSSIVIIPGLLVVTSFLLDKISIVNNVLNLIGKYTYQFYLLNMIVLSNITRIFYSKLYMPGIYFDFLFNHSIIIITIVVAILYKTLIDTIMSVIMNKVKGVKV